jgi:precorrin-4 methylase
MTVYKAVASMPDEGEEWDVPAAVVVGLAWIAARRKDPDLTFEQVASEVTLEDFMEKAATVVDDAPLANREQKRSTAKSSARSRTTSTTRPKKSAA